MSVIALPHLERDLRAALARVAKGESLMVFDQGKEIAQISPPSTSEPPLSSKQSLLDFFLASPLRDSGLEISRDGSFERPTAEL